MSNLSDLLPAGASAKQLTFTDSGSGISSKAPVVLNIDGTVSGITSTSNPVAGGTATSFGGTGASGYVYYPAIVYDSANNKMVIFYEDQGNSRYGTAVVATTSGTSISYGTPIVFNSGTTTYINATYDPDTSQTVTVYKDETNSNYGTAIVGSVSGTSISFGSETVYASSNVYYNNVTYDTTNDKVIVAYMDYSANQYGYGAVGTVSGTSISFGSATVFESGSSNYISICYDSSTDRSVIFYQDNDDSSKGKVVVGTTSGTSISFGSAVIFEATQVYETSSVFDSTANRAVVVFRTGGGDTQIVAGEVSGTSITVGTSVMVGYGKGIAFDSNAGKTVIPFENASGNAVYRLASVSGTTPSVDAEVTFNTPGGNLGGQLYAAYNSTDRVAVFTYAPTSDYLGYATVVRPVAFDVTNLTAQAFVGVADSAISASAAGSVIVQGGTVGGISLGTGISLGATSTVETVDPVGLWANGLNIYDSTNNKHIIVYLDTAASLAGHGVVGTISGTTVSYGTPVVFQSQNLEYLGGAYDSTNEKVLVCYRGYDTGQNFYLYGVVGTVSGTSISWGTPAALNSTASYMATQGVQFDSNTGKFLVCYQDGGSSSNAAALVATISGTSVSAGTPVSFDSTGSTTNHCVSYDSNAQKFLVTWTRQSNYYAYAAVATISGTSVSFGSTLNWYSASTYYQRVNYDSNAQKHLSLYTRLNGNGLGAAVATISGTSVTYGSATNILDDTIDASEPQQTYDSTAQQMLIFVNVGNSSPYPLTQYTATISGTSVTVSSGTTLLSGNNYLIGQSTYNPSANKTLVLWELSGTSLDSAVGTLGDLPLTTGTKYYVTTTGGFSSSADTPSVNAGLAISTTSLLLNGDS